MENIEEKACLCALNRIFGFEPKIAQALIGHMGSAAEVFRLSPKDLEEITGPHFKYKGQICSAAADSAAEELYRLERQGIQFCGVTENTYPDLLRECEDAPVGLYIRSSTPAAGLWPAKESIGIVGTRDITPYGKEWCIKTVQSLARSGSRPAIISGLALGVDIEAHRTALEEGLPTIGVMATGPDSIYPVRNRHTAERMVSTPGCALITDYPPGTAPLAIHFLRRNRIIAGLSRSIILVESKIRGGGLITCKLGFSYNRDIYALPGRIDDLRSQGCNLLIREKIAEPITSTEALLESLGMKSRSRRSPDTFKERLQGTFGRSSSAEYIDRLHTLLLAISKERGITVEELSLKTGLGYRQTAEATAMLEIEGFISIDLLQRCTINYKNV